MFHVEHSFCRRKSKWLVRAYARRVTIEENRNWGQENLTRMFHVEHCKVNQNFGGMFHVEHWLSDVKTTRRFPPAQLYSATTLTVLQ